MNSVHFVISFSLVVCSHLVISTGFWYEAKLHFMCNNISKNILRILSAGEYFTFDFRNHSHFLVSIILSSFLVCTSFQFSHLRFNVFFISSTNREIVYNQSEHYRPLLWAKPSIILATEKPDVDYTIFVPLNPTLPVTQLLTLCYC